MPSWAILGQAWGLLGPSWIHLRAILGYLRAILRPSWAIFRASWGHLGLSWGLLGPTWGNIGPNPPLGQFSPPRSGPKNGVSPRRRANFGSLQNSCGPKFGSCGNPGGAPCKYQFPLGWPPLPQGHRAFQNPPKADIQEARSRLRAKRGGGHF